MVCVKPGVHHIHVHPVTGWMALATHPDEPDVRYSKRGYKKL